MESRTARVAAHVTRASLDMIRELGETRGIIASKHALGVDTDSLGLHALLVSDAAGALWFHGLVPYGETERGGDEITASVVIRRPRSRLTSPSRLAIPLRESKSGPKAAKILFRRKSPT